MSMRDSVSILLDLTRADVHRYDGVNHGVQVDNDPLVAGIHWAEVRGEC